MHKNSQVSFGIGSDGELLIRSAGNALLIEWKSTCIFHESSVHRHICQAVDRAAAVLWLQVLDSNGECGTTFGGLQLLKFDWQAELFFTTTFISPQSILLSPEQQRCLRMYLAELLKAQ